MERREHTKRQFEGKEEDVNNENEEEEIVFHFSCGKKKQQNEMLKRGSKVKLHNIRAMQGEQRGKALYVLTNLVTLVL